MATTRRSSRTPERQVTPRAVELYREAAPLWKARLACLNSDNLCTHADCTRFNRLAVELHSLLGLGPWQPDVFWVEDVDPPRPDQWESHYPLVRELRDALRARTGVAVDAEGEAVAP